MQLTVKLGGAQGIGFDQLVDDIAGLPQELRPVLIHGGSDETTQLQEALGHPAAFLTSPSGQVSRRTNRRDLEAFVMATALINRRLVEALLGRGVPAFGLSGLDGKVVTGRRKQAVRDVSGGRPRIIRDQWTGRPETVNADLLQAITRAGYTPVLAPVIASHDGEMLNTDGDRLAAAVAGALRHDTLVILTNVPGLLEDPLDETSLIPSVPSSDLGRAMEFAKGRMRKKLLGVEEALALGVKRVILGDARRSRPLTCALAGEGTVFGEPLPELATMSPTETAPGDLPL